MTGEELGRWNARVLGHVTRYPGLSAYEIARALGLGARPATNKNKVERLLIRLQDAGEVMPEMVPWPAPGGRKRIWRPAR